MAKHQSLSYTKINASTRMRIYLYPFEETHVGPIDLTYPLNLTKPSWYRITTSRIAVLCSAADKLTKSEHEFSLDEVHLTSKLRAIIIIFKAYSRFAVRNGRVETDTQRVSAGPALSTDAKNVR